MIALATADVGGAPTGCLATQAGRFPLRDLSALAPAARVPDTVAGIVADWATCAARLPLLAAAASGATPLPPETPALAPLLYPGKVLCAGANYYDHIAEMGVTDTRREAQRLFFFMKPPRTAVVGPGPTVRMPPDTSAFDWEIELVAIIGRRARLVTEAAALSHVAAWTVGIDFSARDLNRVPDSFFKLDWVAGKAHDTCGPMGPHLVPADQVPDPQDLTLRLSVNGTVKQDARTSGMIFGIAEQIARASRICTLEPGDAIFTGTPAGVGAPKGTFLAVGDVVEATIGGIGTLSVTIQPPDAG